MLEQQFELRPVSSVTFCRIEASDERGAELAWKNVAAATQTGDPVIIAPCVFAYLEASPVLTLLNVEERLTQENSPLHIVALEVDATACKGCVVPNTNDHVVAKYCVGFSCRRRHRICDAGSTPDQERVYTQTLQRLKRAGYQNFYNNDDALHVHCHPLFQILLHCATNGKRLYVQHIPPGELWSRQGVTGQKSPLQQIATLAGGRPLLAPCSENFCVSPLALLADPEQVAARAIYVEIRNAWQCSLPETTRQYCSQKHWHDDKPVIKKILTKH